MSKNRNNKGFTLIELLVAVAIMGLLSSVIFASTNSARKKGRDARRLEDIKQIQTALELYYGSNNGAYPGNTDNDNGGWDVGFNGGIDSGDPFISPLVTGGFISRSPGDPVVTTSFGGYNYYRYSAGYSGCDASRGAFYVLGIRDMEASGRPHPQSPGFACGTRNWSNEFDWVIGRFEK